MTVIDEAHVAFLEGVPAQYVSAADAANKPAVGRAWGLRIEGARIVRALVGADSSMVQNLETATRVALAVCDVASYRSIQVKGNILAIEPATAADHDVYTAYQRDFTAALRHADRTTPMDKVWPGSIVAVTIDVDVVFDQTPGSGAGRAVSRAS
jgi:hypothetical protein